MIRPTRKKKAKREPKWRMVERVAALIEKVIDPAAEVQHNVHLPDLETPEHTRQCDVVVTTGPRHRRTRTIVEVQRRDRKVEVAHFDGWVAKMRAVSAQHLICVSAAGYPRSVIAKAAKLGPSVRLVTLRELQVQTPLLRGALGQCILVQHQGTTTFPEVEFLTDQVTLDSLVGRAGALQQHEPAFRLADGATVSLNQVAQRLIANHPELLRHLPSGEHKVALGTTEHVTYLLHERPAHVRLRIVAMVKIESFSVRCDTLEYREIVEGGVVRWVQVGQLQRPGTETDYQFTVVFSEGPDGRLAPQTLNVLGVIPGDVVSAQAGDLRVGPVFLA